MTLSSDGIHDVVDALKMDHLFDGTHGTVDTRFINDAVAAIAKSASLPALANLTSGVSSVTSSPHHMASMSHRIAAQMTAFEAKLANGNHQDLDTDALVDALTETWSDALFDFAISSVGALTGTDPEQSSSFTAEQVSQLEREVAEAKREVQLLESKLIAVMKLNNKTALIA